MRIAVFTDVHANRPALEAVLKDVRAQGVDAVFHTGDALDMGPHPAEVLDLLAAGNVKCVMGNHDAYFADRPLRPSRRLPPYRPPVETEGEVAHIEWTASRLTSAHHHRVSAWPWAIEHTFGGVRLLLLHYALSDTTPDGFAPYPKEEPLTAAALDATFAPHLAPTPPDLIFFGHSHEPTDLTGECGVRYLSPGPLGLPTGGARATTVAPYLLVTLEHGQARVERREVPYDHAPLAKAWRETDIPDKSTILRAFYGGRYL